MAQLTPGWTTNPDVVVAHVDEAYGQPIEATIIEKHGQRGFSLTVPGVGMIVEAFPRNSDDLEVAIWAVQPLASDATTRMALVAFRAMDLPPSLYTLLSGRTVLADMPVDDTSDVKNVARVLAAIGAERRNILVHPEFGSSAHR
jgi:hypothetical protein